MMLRQKSIKIYSSINKRKNKIKPLVINLTKAIFRAIKFVKISKKKVMNRTNRSFRIHMISF